MITTHNSRQTTLHAVLLITSLLILSFLSTLTMCQSNVTSSGPAPDSNTTTTIPSSTPSISSTAAAPPTVSSGTTAPSSGGNTTTTELVSTTSPTPPPPTTSTTSLLTAPPDTSDAPTTSSSSTLLLSTSATTSTTTLTPPPPPTTPGGTSPAAYRIDIPNNPVPSLTSEVTARGVITLFALLMSICGGPTILLETQMTLSGFQFSRCANQSYYEAVENLDKPLAFPDNMMPFVSIGDAQNGYFRGAIVTNAVIVPLIVAIVTILFGFYKVSKDLAEKKRKARQSGGYGDDNELRGMLIGEEQKQQNNNNNNNNSNNEGNSNNNNLEQGLLENKDGKPPAAVPSSPNSNKNPKNPNNNNNSKSNNNKPPSFKQSLLDWMHSGGTQSVVIILFALGSEGAIASIASIGASPIDSPSFGADGTLIVVFLFIFSVLNFTAIKFIAGNTPERFLSCESFIERVPLARPALKAGKDWIPRLNEDRARFIFMGTHCWRPTSMQVQRFMTTVPILFKWFHGPRQEDRRVALAALMNIDPKKLPPPPIAQVLAKRAPAALAQGPPNKKSLAEKMRDQEKLAKGEITQEDLDRKRQEEIDQEKAWEAKVKKEHEDKVKEMEKKLEEERAKEGGMMQVRYRAYLWSSFFFVQLVFASFIGLMRGLARVAETPGGCQGAAGGATGFFIVFAIITGVCRPFNVPLRNITMCIVMCWGALTSIIAAAGGDGFAVEGLTVFGSLLPLFAFFVTCLPKCVLANLYMITAMPITMKPMIDRMNEKYNEENPPTPQPEPVKPEEEKQKEEDEQEKPQPEEEVNDKAEEEQQQEQEQEQSAEQERQGASEEQNKAGTVDSDLDDENVPPPLPEAQKSIDEQQQQQQQQSQEGQIDPDLAPLSIEEVEAGISVGKQSGGGTSSAAVNIDEIEGEQKSVEKTKEEQEDDEYITNQLRKLTVAPPTPPEEYLSANNQQGPGNSNNPPDDDDEELDEGELLSLEEQYSLMGVNPDEVEVLSGKKGSKNLSIGAIMDEADKQQQQQFNNNSNNDVDESSSSSPTTTGKKKRRKKRRNNNDEDVTDTKNNNNNNTTPSSQQRKRQVRFSDDEDFSDDDRNQQQQARYSPREQSNSRRPATEEDIRKMLASEDLPNAREQFMVKGMMLPDQEDRLRRQASNNYYNNNSQNYHQQQPQYHQQKNDSSVALTPAAKKMMDQFQRRQDEKLKQQDIQDERSRMKFYDTAYGGNNNASASDFVRQSPSTSGFQQDRPYEHELTPIPPSSSSSSPRATGGGYKYGDGRRRDFNNDHDDYYYSQQQKEKQRQVDSLLDDVVNDALSSPRAKDAAKKCLLLPGPSNNRHAAGSSSSPKKQPSSSFYSTQAPRNQIHPSQAPLYHAQTGGGGSMSHDIDELLDADDMEEMERLMREAVL